ncbi:MAG: mercury methylation ferredoxin HgcB [Desulfopila sp.]
MKKFRYLEETVQLQFDAALCIGCGRCLQVCPHRVFSATNHKKVRIADRGGCMECGACGMNCPVEAIVVRAGDGCGCATLIIKRWFSRLFRPRGRQNCC